MRNTLSLPFRLMRRLGSFPSVLIAVGLLIGGISACEAISQFINQSPDQLFSVQSARLNGGR